MGFLYHGDQHPGDRGTNYAIREGKAAEVRAAAVATMLVLAIAGSELRLAVQYWKTPHLRVLSVELRTATAWVASGHAGERFAIVNGTPWYYDASAEWFPVLAHGRRDSRTGHGMAARQGLSENLRPSRSSEPDKNISLQ